ncbi:MAG: TRAP transporter large permease subunit [Burkholderiaceae bacterium]|nr:TRAP transporter large permease subunit [Burkholderiaceae bacterium]
MFLGLFILLISGFPVAFGLAAVGLGFGLIGVALGLFTPVLFQALPLRIFGIMQNDVLLAIPFFTFMGIILQRSGMAEDLLDTIGQLFGPVRSGLAVAVVLVGALLAATTGVIAAAVISMGLISLPIMLRYGYNRSIATGSILAAGTLVQIIPPSLVLIVLADQMGRSVGDMYIAALKPGLILVLVYLAFLAALAVIKPSAVPALPPETRIYKEDDGSTGYRSLLVLLAGSALAGYGWYSIHDTIMGPLLDRTDPAPADELVVLSVTVASFFALIMALINYFTGLKLLSVIAERVTFALIPPVVLIFLVLGTIFLGIATPTEGGAIGAIGALIMAWSKRRLTFANLGQSLDQATRLSIFVMFILVGSTIFSFTFNAADGHIWVESLFEDLPGGQTGFLLLVTLLVFVLGFFLDFFEIAFIVVPLLVPVANSLGIDLIWFGIILAMILQTSFLTPPFGFSLFYLRSVAPTQDYVDKVSGKTIEGIKTAQIYRGALVFVVLQVLVTLAVIFYPAHFLGDYKPPASSKVEVELPRADPLDESNPNTQDSEESDGTDGSEKAEGEDEGSAEEDPAAALLREMKQQK